MKPRLVKFGVAAAAAAVGFLLQQVLGNRGSKNGSSLGDSAGRLKEAAAEPIDKIEGVSHDGREMLGDLGRRVSSRLGGDSGSNGDDEPEHDDGAPSLAELAARRDERKERRRQRGSTT